MPHVRWLIIGLVFLATVINYLDRLTISVLAPVITKDLHLSNLEFAQVGVWFLVAYTISQALSGRLYDRIGSKRGFTASVIVWSSAAAATAAATTVGALSACRFVLGLGEAGNWPGAAKVVAEWFPVRERAFAMAIFNSGAALGAVISPPIIVWLQLRYGWQAAFLVTASLGFVWLVLWLLFYQPPDRHPMVTPAERALIAADAAASRDTDAEGKIAWSALLGYRQVWAIVLARFMVDPIWWLYITWLPKYLSDARGFSLAQIGLYAWVPYLAADAGSLTGGALSGYLIARGWSVDRARKTVIAAAALLMPAGILAVRAESAAVALALMCVVLFAFQVWINNVQTLPSDFFPSRAVGSVAGLGGMGAGLGSMLFTLTTGWVVDHFSYTPIFTAAGLLAPVGTLILFALTGRVGRLPLGSLAKTSAMALAMLMVSAPAFAQNTQANARATTASSTDLKDDVPSFDALLAHPVALKRELVGVHPRVFVTKAELDTLRQRARSTHREEWTRALADLPALKGAPPPPPGPQERRSQNNVAFAITGVSLAWAVEQKPDYRDAAKRWMLAAIDYEPWGYTFNKPNVDLAAGHLLYAIGWAYDLLYHELTEPERARVRTSLERHAGLVYDYFRPGGGGQKSFNFTQNHNFIPTAGLAVTALALMGESPDAPKWAALARAHHHRAGQLLSPDGYYYEGMEYWIFSAPWLVHFLDAWEHSTGESLWSSPQIANWKYYLAHVLLPDGQNVFDFGDIWEGPLTRAKRGAEYDRVYPGGTLQSNFNALYRVAARLQDREAQAVAARYASFKHSNLEEYMTLLWRDPQLEAAPMTSLPLVRYFEDSGVVFARTSWDNGATAFAFKAGPPEGHRVAKLLPKIPEWKLSSGHAHPDANSFIIWARGRYLTGDTGYSGLVSARQHNTVTVGGLGQGIESEHDVWRGIPYATLADTRIVSVEGLSSNGKTGPLKIVGDATSSYPASAALKRFQRTFTFHAPDRFTIEDVVETSAPKTVESYLHTDEPVRSGSAADRYQLGSADVWLDTKIVAPKGSRIEPGTTQIRAPGPPGSIEKGAVEERGYELKVTTPAATSTAMTVEMTISGMTNKGAVPYDAVMNMPSRTPDQAKIAVVISANAEWKPVKEALGQGPDRVERSPYGEYFTHPIAGEPVLFFHGGWGKIDAASSAEYIIGRWRPQLLINLGTCGGLDGRVQRLERLIVNRTVVYDIHEAMGDSSEAIADYSTEIDLGWLGEGFPLRHRRAPMYSADRDLVASDVAGLTRRFPDAVAADWESASIARVAARRGTRVLILRAASDLVSEKHGEATGNITLFQTNATATMNLLLDDLRAIVPFVLARLSACPPTLALSPRRGEGSPSPRLRGEGWGEG